MKFNIAALLHTAASMATLVMANSVPWERLDKDNAVSTPRIALSGHGT